MSTGYPTDEAHREELRLVHHENEAIRSVARAENLGLSLRCQRGDHGCLNDGSTCLCRCHDRRENGSRRW